MLFYKNKQSLESESQQVEFERNKQLKRRKMKIAALPVIEHKEQQKII